MKNIGTTSKTFKVTHVPAGTLQSLQPGTTFFEDQPVPFLNQSATVKFSETSFTVRPGQTQKLTAHFTPPAGLDPTLLPIFSGFIDISNADESFHVSYIGAASSLKEVPVVDTSDFFFGVNLPALGSSDGNFVLDARNFTFVGDDFPTVVMRLDFGTSLLLIDLVDANAPINTTLNKRDREPLFTFPHAAKTGTFAQVPVVGNLFEFEFLPRNSDVNVSNKLLSSYRGGD